MTEESEPTRGAESPRRAVPSWLGSRTFWAIAAVVAVLSFGFLFAKHEGASQPGALVPVVTLTGPSQATHGETSRYAVLVRDRFGASMANVPVRVGFWKSHLLELARATTDVGGEATLEVRFPDDFVERRTLVALAEAGVAEGADSLVVAPKGPGAASTFVSTDKPLYQPGQTIHIRALTMLGQTPAADRPSVIEVRTQDNIKVFREEQRSSAFGVVATDFILADQVKLGTYSITVTTPLEGQSAAVGTRPVDVKRYSLPKLKLALEDVSPLTADGIAGKARATWIFGEPVVKGRVTVDLEGWPSKQTVTGITDKEGTFKFDLRLRDVPKLASRPRGVFNVHAKVEVEGGMTSDARAAVSTLEGGEIKIEGFPEGGVLVRGVTQDVFVVVTSREKTEGVYLQTPGGPQVKPSAAGMARVSVHPEVPKTGEVASSTVVHAYGDRGSEGRLELTAASDVLLVRPERDALDAGAPLRVTILGASSGDRVVLRMTKGHEPRVLGSCVVVNPEAGCDVTLAVPADLSGLAWLHAISLPAERREIKAGKRLVMVGGGSRDLALAIAPNRPFYAPRDEGAIDIKVTGVGGVPVKAQLGVAVADEAVFALANVRPDLERIFFTIDKDLAVTRGYGYSAGQQRSLPPPLEPTMAYDPAADREVRSAILSVLTTMPDVGGIETRTSSQVAQRAEASAQAQQHRLIAWGVVLLTAYTLLAFLGFALYGSSRVRAAAATPVPEEALTTFRIETRAFYMDWLLAALGPPLLTFAIAVAAERFGGRVRDEGVLGSWFVLGCFCVFLLVRAVLRVRRTQVAQTEPSLVRALVFLPVAAFLAHLTVVSFVTEKRGGLDYFFSVRDDKFFLLLFIALAAQLTCGVLSVVRQTLLREVTRRGRIWLILSRASFLGLPVTLVLGVVLVVSHVKQRPAGWEEYSLEQYDRAESTSYADNKEGGTGTRAKGEEGSMGKPGGGGGMPNAPSALNAFMAPEPKGRLEPPRTRDFFPETLLWAPAVITDDAGHASVRVPFADSITTWRFGLRAVSRAGQLGSASVPLIVKQDFFVDATLPPLLTQSDEIAMPVTVYSYLPDEQDVALEVEGLGMSTIGAARTVLHLGPRETRGFRFVIRADKAGDRVIRIKATGKTRADALERKVKVVPNGLSVIRAANMHFTGSGRSNLQLPADAIDGGNDLFVKIYGGPLSQVAEGLDGVFTMPHGCFEQTSSVTYPSVLALQFLERVKVISPELERKARAYIADGYQQLISFEVPGGGFSLFGKSPASTTLSAYGLLELSDMARVSSVDEQVLRRTRDWLYTKRSAVNGWRKPEGYYEPENKQPKPDDVLVTAYVTWALAAADGPSDKDPRLAASLDSVAHARGPEAEEPYALTLRANALLAGGRTAEARPLLDRLASAMIRDDEGVHWTSKATGVLYSYGQSMDVEVTGLASHALARAELQPEARAGATSWLAARRTSNGTWSTTQATIAAMRALLDEAKPAPKEPQDIAVLVDGEQAEAFRLETAARDVHRLISLRKWATTGKHTVEVRATGGADVAYQLVAQHYLPWQKQTPGSSSPLGLSVTYAPTAVPAGELTLCRVQVGWRGKEPARMPLVEIGVPPAFEVETAVLDKLVATPESRVQRYTVERSKVTLYLVELAEDKPLTIDLPMRALRPARVVVPASSAYLYYEPEVRAETTPVVMRSL